MVRSRFDLPKISQDLQFGGKTKRDFVGFDLKKVFFDRHTQIMHAYSLTDLRRLPEIHNELDKTIYETRERLKKLPKAPSSDPVNDICTLIYTFTTDLARHVEGVADKDGLLQAISPAHEKFRHAIRSTAPNFQPFEEKLKTKKRLSLPSFLLNEEVDDASDTKDPNDAIYIDEVIERAHQ